MIEYITVNGIRCWLVFFIENNSIQNTIKNNNAVYCVVADFLL